MYHTANFAHTKQRFIASQKSENDCLSIFNLLTSDLLFDELESLLPKHKERLFPPTETLSMFIAQALSSDRSCQNIVNQAAVQRLVSGLPACSTNTSGYCQARVRLPLEMVKQLARHVGQLIDQQVPKDWRWQGRRVRLVDGTTVVMPDTPENQAAFPQQQTQKQGLGFPICRLVGITCLSSGAMLSAAMSPYSGKGSDEQTLLRSMQQTLESGDILLGDALYPTFFLIVAMIDQGVDILMEQLGIRRRVTDFRRGKKLGQRDHIVTLKKPKKKPDWMTETAFLSAPETIAVRELKAGGKILITTMLCPKAAGKAALKALFKQRWDVELDIRNIKETMGMEMLSCKSPEMVTKEIWVYLLAYNLIRLLMLQSACMAGVTPRKLSFKHCLQLWLLWSHKADSLDNDQLTMLCVLMAQQRVGCRPGRVEPRAVKRRPKPYPLLIQTRDQAQRCIRKFGHPKKSK